MPAPFLSLLVDDCIAKGRDYNDGGPRYNSTYIMGVAPGTCTDSLAAIKYHVFDQQNLTMARTAGGAARRTSGPREDAPAAVEQDAEIRQRRRLRRRASWQQVFDAFFDEINGRPNTKGGSYRVNYLSTTCHVYFGSRDRRHARWPQGLGAAFRRHFPGAGRRPARAHGGHQIGRPHGPRPHRRHVAEPEIHAQAGGRRGRSRPTWPHLVRSYFKLDGHHIQFNVVDRRNAARSAGASPSSIAI